jgi:hypothetical protein
LGPVNPNFHFEDWPIGLISDGKIFEKFMTNKDRGLVIVKACMTL